MNNDDYNIRSIPVLAVFLICIQSITQTVTVCMSLNSCHFLAFLPMEFSVIAQN